MKIRPVIRLAALATLAALIITTVPWLIGAALAATGVAPVVPPPTPDALMAYVQAYGWLVGSLTVGYVAAKWLLKRNESTHWIAQGRALAVVTTIIGVAGTALQAYTAGTPWSGVLVTALLGLLHLADAQVTPAPRAEQGGFGRLNVMAVLAMVGMSPLLLGVAVAIVTPSSGCTKAQLGGVATSAEHAVINCTGQALGTTPALDLATLVAIANTVAAERAKCMTPAGLDWKCVETDAIGEGKVLGGCSLVKLIEGAAAAAPSSAVLLASPTPGPPPGRPELEDFRARVAGGATFHTASGDF